jgi:rod shape-determining protein MreC
MLETRTRSRWTTLATLLAVSLMLALLHQTGWLAPAERLAAAPLAAVQSWLDANLFGLNRLVSTVQQLDELSERAEELERDNNRLAVENVALREQVNRLLIFEKLLKYERENSEFRFLAADVIGHDTNTALQTIRLNRGLGDGVDNGMPVVSERGLVGRVIEVGPNWSQVLLLVDPTSAVRARLGQSRAEGLVSGRGRAALLIDYLTQGIEISPGEYVLTSGMGGTLPAGLVIGQVTTVRQSDEALFQQADVRPSVDFDRLEVVLIITNFERAPGEAGPPDDPQNR